jgi:hypothetical protein
MSMGRVTIVDYRYYQIGEPARKIGGRGCGVAADLLTAMTVMWPTTRSLVLETPEPIGWPAKCNQISRNKNKVLT